MGSSRRRQSEYMSSEQSEYTQEVEQAEARLEAGPSSSDYEPGSPSEHYVPTAIATPILAGEPATVSSLERLTSREDTNS